MIWESIWLMTVVDVSIIAVSAYSLRSFLKTRLLSLSSATGFSLIGMGILVIALFYLTDLFAMHVLPSIISRQDAMAAMAELHLNYSWPVMLFGVASVAAGLAALSRDIAVQGRAEENSKSQIWWLPTVKAPRHPLGSAALTLVIVLSLAFLWEFILKDMLATAFGMEVGQDTDGLEFILVVAIFVAMALVAPTILSLNLARERHQAERALRESELKFRSLTEDSTQGVAVHRKGKIVYVNGAFAKIFGRELQDLLGTDIVDVLDPAEVGRVRELRKHRRGRLFGLEAHRPDGSSIWVDSIAKDLVWEGQPARQVTLSDVTPRIQAERALLESEAKFRGLTEDSAQGMMIYQDEKVVYANQAFADMAGHELEEFIGLELEKLIPPVEHDRAADSRKHDREKITYAQMLRKDGSLIWVDLITRDMEWEGKPARQIAAMDVTDRKRIEDALRQQAVVMAQMSEAVVVNDLDRNIIDCNMSTSRMFGYGRDEILGQTPDFLMKNPEMWREDRPGIMEEVGQGKSWTGEVELRRNDGTEFPGELTLASLCDDSGKLIGIVSVIRDITERKCTEDALRQQAVIIEQMSEAVTVSNLDRAIIDCNPAATRMFGYDREEFLGKKTISLVRDAEDWNAKRAAVIKAVEDDGSWSGEVEYSRKDGSVFIGELTLAPLFGGGSEYDALIAVIRDVTDRKSAESAREKTSHLLGQIAKIQDEFIAGADPTEVFDGLLSVLLSCTESEYGFMGEILRDDAGKLFLKTSAITNISWDDETRAFYDKNAPVGMEFSNQESIFGKVIKTGKLYISNDPSNDSNRGGLPKGHPALNSFLGIPFIKDGDFIGMAGIANRPGGYNEDIITSVRPIIATMANQIQAWRTEKQRQSIEQALKASEDQLRQAQKMEAVGQLTGGLAHDFNNILAIILGNLELLKEEVAGDEKYSDFITTSIFAAVRGAELTHRLLAFSRKQTLQPVALDLNKVVAGMEHLLKRTLREDIDLRWHLEAGDWLAQVDASQLENAILNLAVNARDAMPAGGRLTIETGKVTLDDEYAKSRAEVIVGDYVMLAVSDTGSGMDADTLAQVFEPFFTTKEVGKGTGLGLSMVYGFAKQSGGHASIYSEPGQGTTVRLYLPRTQSAESEPTVKDQESLSEGGHETILVVEDDDAVRNIVTRILKRLGYTVFEAGDGQAALGILKDGNDVDLLLTDVVLPGGMSGPEMGKAAQEKTPGLRILYMSGYTENAVLHHSRVDEGVNLIGKPFSPSDLGAKIWEVLDSGP